MLTVKAGLAGLGIVGGGVLEVLNKQKKFFSSCLGIDVSIKTIAEKDPSKLKDKNLDGIKITDNVDDIINDPEIQIVIELIGGIGIAKDIVLKSIEAGKNVVTANKYLLAKFGHEIFPKADSKNVSVYFEASVAGGIPIIKSLREGLVANDILNVQCIINGTTNYILSKMKKEGRAFDKILADAQKNGFAETDPSFDINGIDAAHKVAIMANLAYGCWVKLEDVYTEGISNITQEDISYADKLGYVIKLLGIIRKKGDKIDIRVHPAMLPLDHLLANVNGVFNGIALIGDSVGSLLFTGKGAGRYPTASAVVSDVIDICRNLKCKNPNRIPMDFICEKKRVEVIPISEIESRYYLRFTVVDEPGVLAKLTASLGDQHVSIASVIQKECSPKNKVPVVILTHHAKEALLKNAVAKINSMDIIKHQTQIIRIEEEKEKT